MFADRHSAPKYGHQKGPSPPRRSTWTWQTSQRCIKSHAGPPHGGRPTLRPGRAPPGTPGVPPPEIDARRPHVASPDVHVDKANRRIVMFLHGPVDWGMQRTRAALSADGIAFQALPELLGPSYFRVFRHAGTTYALVMPGILFRSVDGLIGFERGHVLFPGGLQRHTALLLRDGVRTSFGRASATRRRASCIRASRCAATGGTGVRSASLRCCFGQRCRGRAATCPPRLPSAGR
jgi:hypothetical protein